MRLSFRVQVDGQGVDRGKEKKERKKESWLLDSIDWGGVGSDLCIA